MDEQLLLENTINLYRDIDIPALILNNRLEMVWLSSSAEELYPQYKLRGGFASVLSDSLRQAIVKALLKKRVYCFSVERISEQRANCTMTPLFCKDRLCYVLVQLSQAEDYPESDSEDISRVIATFSKHVREPLFYIFSALSTIGHRFETAEDYASLQYVQSIQKNSYAILRTVAHLSDYVKDVNGIPSHTPTPVLFTAYIKDLYTAAEAVTRKTGVPFLLEVEPGAESNMVMVDAQHLSEAILNILLNSFLYTREGNRITMSLRYIASSAVITVSDQGAGIPSQYLGKVFAPHFSYDTDNAPLRNAGLGLTLARNIILRHGGVIALDSRENEGTSVTVRLPVLPAQDYPELLQQSSLNLQNRFSPVYIELAGISGEQML